MDHFAVTSDSNETRLYIDGAFSLVFPAISITSEGNETRLGRQFEGGAEFFGGSLDELWVYSGVFDPAEVATLASMVPPNPDAPNLVWIPSGAFTMGSPANEVDRASDEGPQTVVHVSRGFWIGKYEVTQRQLLAVADSVPPSLSADPDSPVVAVNWMDAHRYCAKLTQSEKSAGRLPAGYAYRLPTEADREYACRALTVTRFHYGDDPGYAELENYAWKLGGQTHQAGLKEPNPWGLYDLYGNVWEWCLDAYPYTYSGSSGRILWGPPTVHPRRCGGSIGGTHGSIFRSANRDYDPETFRTTCIGFRVVLAAVPEIHEVQLPDPELDTWYAKRCPYRTNSKHQRLAGLSAPPIG